MIRLTSHMSFNLATQAQGVQRPIKKNFHKILRLVNLQENR